MKIEWAPVKVPPRRRFQTLVTGSYAFAFFGLPLTSLLIIVSLLYYGNLLVRALLLAYVTFIYYHHTRKHSAMDGNGWTFLRNNFINKHYRNYFPVELIKTADLPPNKNYIVVSFPHGILGTGICINMGVDIENWLKFYPGVRPKIATLDQHFLTPILREFLRVWGFVSVSKESLTYYLRKSNDPKHADNKDGFTSNAVAILVGGAQEALDSHPGKYVITLKPRKGFVKLAIRTGSPIVPSFSFGEVDIYDQMDNPPDSVLRKCQTFVKKATGIAPLIVVGRGFFNYSFGFLPHRRHIVQVVGAPIEVTQSDSPDPKYVDEIHQKVIEALDDIFEQYKSKYIQNAAEAHLVVL